MDDETMSHEEIMTRELRHRARQALKLALKALGSSERGCPTEQDVEASTQAEAAVECLAVLRTMHFEHEMQDEANREPPVLGGPGYTLDL
jgi:hypothetical protein